MLDFFVNTKPHWRYISGVCLKWWTYIQYKIDRQNKIKICIFTQDLNWCNWIMIGLYSGGEMMRFGKHNEYYKIRFPELEKIVWIDNIRLSRPYILLLIVQAEDCYLPNQHNISRSHFISQNNSRSHSFIPTKKHKQYLPKNTITKKSATINTLQLPINEKSMTFCQPMKAKNILFLFLWIRISPISPHSIISPEKCACVPLRTDRGRRDWKGLRGRKMTEKGWASQNHYRYHVKD